LALPGTYNQAQWIGSSLANGASQTLTIVALVNQQVFKHSLLLIEIDQIISNSSTSSTSPIPK
jgi:hypothetical protein